MAEPVRVRRLSGQEGQKLQQIVRRGNTSPVRYRRAMMLLASAGGNRVPVIAQLGQADEDTVRDVIHRFNEIGLAFLDPQWAGGRPRLLSRDEEDFVTQTATTRRTKGAGNTLAALRSIRAARPDGAPIYVILDNLSVRKGADIRRWAKKHKVELCFTPTLRLMGKPDRGALRTVAAVHHRRLRLSQSPGADPGPAHLPALAQRQCPPPRRPGRRTKGTRPHPE